MKLIEKKCPNCGADLKFNKDDDTVTCNYCKTSYEIQRDIGVDDIVNELFDADDFILHKKAMKSVNKGIMFFIIFVFVMILIVFLIMFLNIFPRVVR